MKLCFVTANEPQRSRCGNIGSPEGWKMSIINKRKSFGERTNSNFTKYKGKALISLKIEYGIDIFYEYFRISDL